MASSHLWWAVLLVSAARLASPQSFDCSKAATRSEKLVCGDDGLKSLDLRLAQAYKRAVSRLSTPETKFQLQQDEQLWLKDRFNECRTANCLTTAYQERIAFLEAYSTEPAAKGVAYRLEAARINAALSLPQVRSTPLTQAARQFNAMVREAAQPTGQDAKMLGRYEAQIVGNRYVSAYLILASDAGGAHPLPVRQSYVFDLERGEALPLAKLFQPGANYLPVLAKFARASLAVQVKKGEWSADAEWIRKGTEPLPEKYEAFTITDAALVLHFPPYQVGPYVNGDATVTVPAAALTAILDPAGPLGKTPSAASR